jgi:DNA-binding NarL/FixJ family response regulator
VTRSIAPARLAVLSPEQDGPDGPFTPREAEVVALVAQGWTDARIARWLGLSESGVRHRLTSARDRVRAANRAELVGRWTELHR